MTDAKFDVLFVDDDPNILKAIKRNLRGKFEICVAETIEDAINKINQYSFPVVISDMKMPVMNGADFLILVKETQPEAIRILLTGESSLEEAIKAINESDIYKFLKKPCPAEKLVETINNALKIYNAGRIEELIMEKSVKGFVLTVSNLMNTISPEIFKKSSDVSKLLKAPKTQLPIKDKWSVEVAAMLMYLGSIHYKVYSYDKIYNSETMVKVLHKSAKLMHKIPKFEKVHSILSELAGFYEEKIVIEKLDSDSKSLKLIIDYYHMLADTNFTEQFQAMYSEKVVNEIPRLFGKKEQDKVLEITADKLEPAMIAKENITTLSGSILVSKGDCISNNDMANLILFASKSILHEPFKVERAN